MTATHTTPLLPGVANWLLEFIGIAPFGWRLVIGIASRLRLLIPNQQSWFYTRNTFYGAYWSHTLGSLQAALESSSILRSSFRTSKHLETGQERCTNNIYLGHSRTRYRKHWAGLAGCMGRVGLSMVLFVSDDFPTRTMSHRFERCAEEALFCHLILIIFQHHCFGILGLRAGRRTTLFYERVNWKAKSC